LDNWSGNSVVKDAIQQQSSPLFAFVLVEAGIFSETGESFEHQQQMQLLRINAKHFAKFCELYQSALSCPARLTTSCIYNCVENAESTSQEVKTVAQTQHQLTVLDKSNNISTRCNSNSH